MKISMLNVAVICFPRRRNRLLQMHAESPFLSLLISEVRVVSSAGDTPLEKCGLHTCHVSYQLQTAVVGLNLPFYIITFFLYAEIVSSR